MILFFVVTATMNIALGYGLAVYLGHARRVHETHVVASPVESAIVAPVEHQAAPPAVAEEPLAAPASVPTPALVPIAAATAPATADEASLERDVLAGIEEFRNQLAQMKAQPVEADAMKTPALAGV